MINTTLFNAACFCVLWTVSGLTFATPSVEVFATSTQTMTDIGSDMTYCDVDEAATLTNQLNRMADELVQQGKNQQEINNALSEQFAANQHHMADAARCLADVVNFHIKQLPAIVINQQTVVYGDTDVPHALSLALQSERTGEAR